MAGTITLGTRGSELALRQAGLVAAALQQGRPDLTVERQVIRTSGDAEYQSEALPPAGRKGLFTSEIERALVSGEINIAVHSAKDLPSELNPETEIAAALARGTVEDVLLSRDPYDLKSLPRGAVVATGSVRRKHQLLWKRPDLEVVDLRGNVPTRLRKLAESEWHAIILAAAGLERLAARKDDETVICDGKKFFAHTLTFEEFLPAGGQGIIAVQIRAGDDRVRALLGPINHVETAFCLRAEREFLRLLQGDCNQPVGVLARIDADKMTVSAQVFDPEPIAPRESRVEGPRENAESLAADLFAAISQRK